MVNVLVYFSLFKCSFCVGGMTMNVNIKFCGEKSGEKNLSVDVHLMIKDGATFDSFAY